MDSRLWYGGLMLLVAGERLVEIVLSRRNRSRAMAAGGVEYGEGHYRWMVVVHGLFLAAGPLEVWLLGRRFVPALGAPMLGISVLAMGLRYWAVASLGVRWNTRVIVMPGRPPVATGPYRHLRHPNYLAVAMEIMALPLVHSAWITALVFTTLNALILKIRIPVEETALATAARAAGGPRAGEGRA